MMGLIMRERNEALETQHNKPPSQQFHEAMSKENYFISFLRGSETEGARVAAYKNSGEESTSEYSSITSTKAV